MEVSNELFDKYKDRYKYWFDDAWYPENGERHTKEEKALKNERMTMPLRKNPDFIEYVREMEREEFHQRLIENERAREQRAKNRMGEQELEDILTHARSILGSFQKEVEDQKKKKALKQSKLAFKTQSKTQKELSDVVIPLSLPSQSQKKE